ncbi:hypothetical protein G3I76_07895, partial [Streptomyces sp. SID11233]|nr:hypothetical protein [Streptomyces sp. SID11233]
TDASDRLAELDGVEFTDAYEDEDAEAGEESGAAEHVTAEDVAAKDVTADDAESEDVPFEDARGADDGREARQDD